MIIDTTGRKPKVFGRKDVPAPKGQVEAIKTGDVVEVEIIRNGKTLYKGR